MPSFLDFKLGARMLAKYPGLALVGGFGMAVATAIGVGTFAFVNTYLYPDIPLHEGARVVAIINLDARTGNGERHLLHDFVSWRADLRSFVDVSAFRTSQRNLIASTGQTGEPVSVAEMSASGFRVARVPPLLGRVLVDADDRPEAPPVVVIGHDVWQARFQADPSIVGRTIRLNGVVHTVVGVMPAGFAFPISHSYWVPLRANPSAYERGAGPELDVFARLAPGSKKNEAQAELTVIGRRAAAANPKTHPRLEPRVVPFTDVFARGEGVTWELVIMQAMIAMILVLVCLNVAILVYARTVTRTGEIAVRTALGATRVRIVTQLFTEAFVLSVLSALAGLGLVVIGLRYFDDLIVMISATGGVPFWIQPGLSAGTILYALALAVLAAAIVGILPALKATGADLQTTLGSVKSGAQGRLGRTWTFLIVTQVAITVAVLPPVVAKAALLRAQATQRPGFAAEEVLAVALEREDAALRATHLALIARIESEPVVTGVTFADGVPGDDSDDRIEIDGLGTTHRIRTSRVGANYFDVFDVKVGAGRTFNPSDVAPALNGPVIVNRSLAEKTFGGGQVVGRRIRYIRDDAVAQPWHTIVGVVEDFPAGFKERGRTDAKVYHVAAPEGPEGSRLLIRLRGQTPAAFVATLREIATATDPTLQLRRARPLDVVYFERRRAMRMAALALALTTGSILLLSSGGIYALMSFTVNQRRKEIGIRAALGADARRILTSVLSRATWQLVLGVTVGLGLSVVVDRLSGGALMDGRGLVLVPGIAGFMAIVGLLAAAGPARRGLRVQPTEALRAE